MLKVLGILFAALCLFAAGHAVRGWQDRVQVREEAHRADSLLQAGRVRFARERDSLTLARERESQRAASAEASAIAKRRSAAVLKLRADSLQSVLTLQTNAIDSLPIVVQQRDGLQLAYDSLAVGFDSLQEANGSLRTIVRTQDSLATIASTESALREKALRSLNDRLRLELAHAQNRGKLLGVIRVPSWAVFAAGGVAGFLLKP